MTFIPKIMLLTLLAFAGLSVFAEGDSTTSGTLPKLREATPSSFKPSLGISAGLATSEDGHREGADYGIEYGFQPYIPFSTAVELSGTTTNSSGDQGGITRTKILTKGAYNFGGNIPLIRHSYMGVGIGAILDNEKNFTSTNLGIMPNVGFDIPLGGQDFRYTLGANANYLFVAGGRPDTFALNGVAKYWF